MTVGVTKDGVVGFGTGVIPSSEIPLAPGPLFSVVISCFRLPALDATKVLPIEHFRTERKIRHFFRKN